MKTPPANLDLALIGNGSIGALIDSRGGIVWACLPRFDSEPVFDSLLKNRSGPDTPGSYCVQLMGFVRSEQEYLKNTAVVMTRLFDRGRGRRRGNGLCTQVQAVRTHVPSRHPRAPHPTHCR